MNISKKKFGNKQLTFMKKTYRNILKLIYGNRISMFEDKLMVITSLSISFMLLIATIFNILVGLNQAIILSTFVGFFIYSGLYIYGRTFRFGIYFKWLTSIFSLIYLDFIWLFNYGSKGPSLTLFVVLYSFMVLVFEKKNYIVLYLVFFLNLTGMFICEYSFPELIGDYENLLVRNLDLYSGTAFSLIILASFTYAIKTNYIKEYNRAKMSDNLKSAFVANMSHEIRTPLNAIVGFSSLISDAELNEKDRQMFEKQIQNNSDYLLNLIEDIIDVSKIESNQLNINIKEVNVLPIMKKIVHSFKYSMSENKNVQVFIKPDIPEIIIKIDKVRFEQIIRNLLSNAIKFTDKGIIELGCKTEVDNYIFFVKDTGIGIHIEHQKMIFERFMKIENSKQQFHRGTGIGLFLTKQLVDLFGGRIWVESEIGIGSIFYFSIPRKH